MSWVIVALPEDRDPVWKYSSEKKPHMTLLFLGDDTDKADLPSIVGYIQHVAKTSLRPFGMLTDRRGTLGDEEADVLFFEKDKHNQAVITHARDYLLADPGIKTLYDSADQYPEWTPHLTMGYPAKPAKKDDREHGNFGYVSFDRIALWTDDYEGPEFRLEGRDDMAVQPEMMMSDRLGEFLAHFGVKGMKWGVRNDRGHEGERAKTKDIAKADKKYEKSFSGMSGYIKIHNAMAEEMNSRLGALNDKHPNVSLFDKPLTDPANKAYLKDYEELVAKSAEKAMENFGTNASGTGRVKVSKVGEGLDTFWEASWEDIKHADGPPNMKIIPTFKNGRIVSVKVKGLELKQSDEKLGAFLEHYGVKGMRWGRRKNNGEAVQVEVGTRPGSKAVARGGENYRPSEDAKRAAAAKQVAKKSTTDALSTPELQELVTRMNLEQQYSKLTTNQTSPGKKFIGDLLGNAGKQQAQKIVNEQVGRLATEAVKRAASR